MEDQYQVLEPASSPVPARRSPHVRNVLLFVMLALFTFVLAAVWGVYDAGWYVGPWGKLAFAALTWFALVITLYKLFFKERVK